MEKIIYEKVGARLKYARELRDISLEKAGETVGVHKSTILRWERGNTEKFKIPTLEILADLYEVNLVWLMGYDVPMEKSEIIEENSICTPHDKVNTDGLTSDEIAEVNRYADFLRNKKKK